MCWDEAFELVSSHARSWVDPLMLDAVGPVLKSQLVLKC